MAGAGIGGGQPFDAHTAARYSLIVDGAEIAVFSDLVDLTSALDPSEQPRDDDRGGRGGGGGGARKKKRPSHATVTLKRGQNNDLSLFAWHRQTLAGEDGRNAVLAMFATDGTRVARYNLESAWPAKIEVTGERGIASAAEVLFETVTFACRGIERVSP